MSGSNTPRFDYIRDDVRWTVSSPRDNSEYSPRVIKEMLGEDEYRNFHNAIERGALYHISSSGEKFFINKNYKPYIREFANDEVDTGDMMPTGDTASNDGVADAGDTANAVSSPIDNVVVTDEN